MKLYERSNNRVSLRSILNNYNYVLQIYQTYREFIEANLQANLNINPNLNCKTNQQIWMKSNNKKRRILPKKISEI